MVYENRIREPLAAGETVYGAKVTTMSPVMIEVFADEGIDYVWLDHEHIGAPASDSTTLERVRRTASAAGIEPVVRIESGHAHEIRKVLDTGIRSFVVPRIETARDVRKAVSAARFEFEGEPGERGVGTGLANTWGARPDDYIEHEDREVLPGVMLENASALENIDDILSVPGLGFCQIGPSDLSVSLGHPLEQDHPEVRAAMETFFDAGEEHGVPIGVSRGYVGSVEAALEMGASLVNIGSDVGAARSIGDRVPE
ncbi:MAG: HpcH/HpaI aldolase/citrate lyase family protein [Salinirussus sp.]